jgi:hypothetical protein
LLLAYFLFAFFGLPFFGGLKPMSSALFPKNFSLFNLRHYQRYNCRHGAGRRTLPCACYVLACYLNEALQKLPRFQALPVPIDKPSCALISRRVQPVQAKMRLALFWIAANCAATRVSPEDAISHPCRR